MAAAALWGIPPSAPPQGSPILADIVTRSTLVVTLHLYIVPLVFKETINSQQYAMRFEVFTYLVNVH